MGSQTENTIIVATSKCLINKFKMFAASISMSFVLCWIVTSSTASPIDDGSFMDDESRITRRHDVMPGFGHSEQFFETSEIDNQRLEKQTLPRQARNIENKVDPSFILSKFLYHMAQLPSV